jgi:hypothetical protein
MLRLIISLVILVSINFNLNAQKDFQDPYKDRREVIGKNQTFKLGLDTYNDDSGLRVDIIFPQTVVLFAIFGIDEAHFLPLPDELNGKLFGEFWWTGNIHRHGYCKIEVKLNNERFLVCTNKECYILEISKPEERVERRTVYLFTYRDTKLIWDDEKRTLVNEKHKAQF